LQRLDQLEKRRELYAMHGSITTFFFLFVRRRRRTSLAGLIMAVILFLVEIVAAIYVLFITLMEID